jgi:hypothetical protein
MIIYGNHSDVVALKNLVCGRDSCRRSSCGSNGSSKHMDQMTPLTLRRESRTVMQWRKSSQSDSRMEML